MITYLAVAVRDMPTLVSKRRNDISKAAEALVDVLRLLQSLALRLRVREAFASSEIHQVQSAFAALPSDRVDPRQ